MLNCLMVYLLFNFVTIKGSVNLNVLYRVHMCYDAHLKIKIKRALNSPLDCWSLLLIVANPGLKRR
jgi:hypothetical protein